MVSLLERGRLRFFRSVLVLAVLAAGSAAPATAADREITMGYIAGSWPLDPIGLVMKAKKLVEAEGLRVKWGEYLAGAYIMQHMASGEVDFSVAVGVAPVMISQSQGLDVTVLAGGSTVEGSVLVVSPAVKNLKDLDGKRIGTPGIGSIQDAMLRMIARKQGIKIRHRHMKAADMPPLLQKGEIDGFIVWEPVGSLAVELGYGRVLATSGEVLPGQRCCLFVARSELVRKNPEQVRKVFSAYMKAFDYYRKNRDEATDLIARHTNTPRKVIEAAQKHVRVAYPPSIDLADLKFQTEELIKDGKIQAGAIPDIDRFLEKGINNSFLREQLDRKDR